MLVIRMQRTGRKGHAQFRVVVQDSRRTPTSGKIVASLGSFDPHAKTTTLDKEKAQFYMDHGAQPSDRVARLLKSEGVKLPKWVTDATKKESTVRNPDKRRSTRPAEPEAPGEPEAPAEEAETPTETIEETPAETSEEVETAATDIAVEETLTDPVESTEKLAEAEEVAADEAAKADEADVTDENQDATEEPAPEA